MGCGASHYSTRKLDSYNVDDNLVAREERLKPDRETTNAKMEPHSTEQDEMQRILSRAENSASVLRSHLYEETLASETALAGCKELLRFSCSIGENEQVLVKATNSIIEKKIPQLFLQVYGAVRSKYPDVQSYDREKHGEDKALTELAQAQDVLNLLAGATVNLTDEPQLAVEFGHSGLIPVFLEITDALKDSIPDMDPETKMIYKFTVRGHTLSRILGALVNLAKQVSNRLYFLDSHGIKYLLPFLTSKVNAYFTKSLFCLAYLIDEDNNETIMADTEPIKFIIEMLAKAIKSPSRAYLGFSTSDIADGLSRLAVNENNSKQVGSNGGIPVVVDLLRSSQDDPEKLGGTKMLWMLSFNSINREIIKNVPFAIEVLQVLTRHIKTDISRAAFGALWEIEKNRHVSNSGPRKQQHVMISYQWDVQDIMIQVKNRLKSAGFNVWIDVEQMAGSTLETMASAVEDSAVFLMAASRKYKESPNCRSEAEYAFQLKKDIVPLMMEPRFKPDGWLGIILGTKLWVDFREPRSIETGINRLIKELGSRGKHRGAKWEKTDSDDDLKKTLLLYKKKHRSIYVYFSEAEKIIRGLRCIIMSGQLATEGAFWKIDSLVALYINVSDQQNRSLLLNFFVKVNVPELLMNIVKSLRSNFSAVFSSDREEAQSQPKKKKKATEGRTPDEERPEITSESNWAVEVMLSTAVAILNCSDLHDEFCEVCGREGMIPEFLALAEQLKNVTPETDKHKVSPTTAEVKDIHFTRRGSLLFDVLGVLHNLAKRPNNKKYFANNTAIQTMLTFFRSNVPVYRMTALLSLAYLVDEKNNHLIMSSDEPIKDIIQLLDKAIKSADRQRLGFSAEEIAYGLSHVATNDGNKRTIGRLGGVPLLASLLRNPNSNDGERLSAAKALYMLSFDKANKEEIARDQDTLPVLRGLQESGNKDIQQTAAGVLWEIEGKKGHVSSSEAEYAYQKRKRIIPLMMEPSYTPDGWLGMILGTKLWMDFRRDPRVGIDHLMKELAKDVVPRLQSLTSSPATHTTKRETVNKWQRADVAQWLHTIGFDVGSNAVRKKLDGPLLLMLSDLRKESPEFFYNSIKQDLGLPTVIEVLRFTKELKELLG